MSTWILILMTNWHGSFEYKSTTASPVAVTSIKFNSKETCVAASKFLTSKNKKVYSANCVKK